MPKKKAGRKQEMDRVASEPATAANARAKSLQWCPPGSREQDVCASGPGVKLGLTAGDASPSKLGR